MGAPLARLFLVLGGAAGFVGHGETACAKEQEGSSIPAGNGEIVVNGSARNDPLADLIAEAELDENGIAAYGHDTVGELLGEVLRQVAPSDEGPIVLVNGRQTTGISAIADLPNEAVAKIQLLPRAAAARLGEPSSRRVVNVIVKSSHRQVTASGSAGLATSGGAFSSEGELNLIKLKDGNRSGLVLSARHFDPLFESERPLIPSLSGTRFDPIGNILPSPSSVVDIDPALSAIVGEVVRIAGVPIGKSNPSLADFAALANRPNLGVPVRNRTLVSEQQLYSANANFARNLGPRTELSLNLRATHSRSIASTGATTATFVFPASSPYSPFGRDVLLARTVGETLRSENDSNELSFAAIVNTAFGRWRLSTGASYLNRSFDGSNERAINTAIYQDGISAGSINPFADTITGTPPEERTRARSEDSRLFATFAGSPLRLPAGPVNLSLRMEWRGSKVSTNSVGPDFDTTTRLHRDERIAHLSFTLPLLSGRSSLGLGAVELEFSGTLRDLTNSKCMRDFAAAINWRPASALSLRGSVREERFAPAPSLLTDPITITENVRTFDFVRSETVFVRQVTGGNPDLGVETRRTTSFSGTLLPFDSPDLTLDAEYSRVVNLNSYSSLPPASADVQAAFPDRFQRDASGALVVVDARPVPLARLGRSQIRWGFTFSRTVMAAGNTSRAAAPDVSPEARNVLEPGLRLNLFGTHLWTLSSTQLIRAGLPVIDVLEGGATSNATGSTRHMAQFGGGFARRGIGLQLSGTLFGPRTVLAGTPVSATRIDFAGRTQVDLRLFANLGQVFAQSPLAQGARLSLEINNLFEAKQHVSDQEGLTPERYQPYLIDPVGRRVTIKWRKVL